jgi:lipoprotein-anchoring transpeptidase ErfK/SrfK
MRNIEQSAVQPALTKPGRFFEAVVENIRKYLLRRHLTHWHPISTAPNNQDLELRLVDQHRLMRLSFPCRRNNAGIWINADLGTRLQIEPIAWRRWQKAAVPHAAFSASQKGPAPLLQRAAAVRALGMTLLVIAGAAWVGAAHAQTIAMNTRSDGAFASPRIAPDSISDAASPFPARLHRQIVDYRMAEPPGTVIIDTPNTYLYFVLGGGRAIRYGVGIGREGFTWSGIKAIERKTEWPDWIPPADMLHRQPYLPRFMAGGPGNPLGARAMYLAGTVYRIHGTNAPQTIGKQVSSGCIRMLNEDVIDLYDRTRIGGKVVVLPMSHIDPPRSDRPLALTVARGAGIGGSRLR